MVLVAFNKEVKDKDTKELIKAGAPIEMTVKRADEAVKRHSGLSYERIENNDEKDKE